MFYKYEIRNNGTEDILYLYLDIKNEFSKELANSPIEDLNRRTKNFIINNNINFKGNKVYLIIDGIVVKTVNINKVSRTIKNNTSYTNKKYLINLKIDENSFIEITLENYLLSILASFYNDYIQDETLKCISILYRTYTYKEMQENKYIDNNYFINYFDITNYKSIWINKYEYIYNKLLNIINETECMFLSYRNKFILPFIHICNNGYTFTNTKYPYLSQVSSLWDLSCKYNKEIIDYNYEEFSKLLNHSIKYNSSIVIDEVDSNNQIIKIKIDNKIFSGEELKRLLALKSLNFNIILYKKYIRIITFGFGNFLGLSIYGSNELASDNIDYPNILRYYFPLCKLNKYIKEFPN